MNCENEGSLSAMLVWFIPARILLVVLIHSRSTVEVRSFFSFLELFFKVYHHSRCGRTRSELSPLLVEDFLQKIFRPKSYHEVGPRPS